MEEKSAFLTTPLAILIGSILISASVLLSGGVIKLGGTPTAAQPEAPRLGDPNQAKTEEEIKAGLKSLASQLSLDQAKFDSCLDSGEKAEAVAKDLADGSKAGVNETPAFFVNGRLISGALPFDQFKTILDEEVTGKAPVNTARVDVEVGDLPIMGKESAKVTLIEFSDYECPYCERHFTQTEPQIKSEYIDKGLVKFYYRDFPLSQIHPGAQKAAEAARCAGDQNKYWQYHDEVFENQTTIF